MAWVRLLGEGLRQVLNGRIVANAGADVYDRCRAAAELTHAP